MKLELSLPERPGLLHAVPVCNLFLILWLLHVLGSAMVRDSGVMVELPPSQFQLERYEETHVVTLGPGEGVPQIHLGRDRVSMDELMQRFGTLRAEGAQAKAVVLLQTDAGTAVGLERQVAETLLGMGFRVALIGNKPDSRAGVPVKSETPQN